jgi:hypothetical protein
MTYLRSKNHFRIQNLKRFQSLFCKGVLTGAAFGALISVSPANAKGSAAAPAYAVCNHKEADGADLGEHSTLCDASTFGQSSLSESMYGDIIFNRSAEAEGEKSKYVTQLYAFVKAAASDYIQKKENNPSPARVARFAEDIMAVAYHESRLTHYAYGHDRRFKLMAADRRLVSRGLMQINQTFHASRSQDNSLDAFGNITFGMDMIYNNMRYIDKSVDNGSMTCISKKEKQGREYEDLRLRSAWAAYNSGSKFCRFRQNSSWSGNDKAFLMDLKKAEWRHYVLDSNLKTKIDIACISRGDSHCSLSKEPQVKTRNTPTDHVLSLKEGGDCLVNGLTQKITCADSIRSSQCLGVKLGTQKVASEETLASLGHKGAKIYGDREELCSLNIPGLVKVGEFFRLLLPVDLYDQVDGKVLARLKPSQQVYQVIDYEIRDPSTGERCYKISSSHGHFGYIKAGKNSDFKNYVEKVDVPNALTTLSIPVRGNRVTVVAVGGLNVFKEPNVGSLVSGSLPERTTLYADDVVIKGSDNQIYIKTSQGFIYAGRSYLSNTTSQYVRFE